MGLFDFLKSIFSSTPPMREPNLIPSETGLPAEELARRLGLPMDTMMQIPVDYHSFEIPKKNGGKRTITAPNPELKAVQRRILKRLLSKLSCHPCATGFEKGHSIVTNAIPHVNTDVVLKMDLIAFFNKTTAKRVRGYFYGIGWSKEATDILIRLCTHYDYLPQGAPTSPRLSNLVNIEMDARLAGLAAKFGAAYTRYADDMTFSFYEAEDFSSQSKGGQNLRDLKEIIPCIKPRDPVNWTIRLTKDILRQYGYQLHNKQKLNIRRRHQQQRVCGLVVNEEVGLPRETRRRLRAVRHHIATNRPVSMTDKQLAGWSALEQMIETQTKANK